MIFSSTIFLFFYFPISIFLYYIVFCSRKARNIFLLIASLFFYAWGEPWFVFIMILSILVNWFFGILVDKYRENRKIANAIVAVSVVCNLLIIFIFKYLNFSIKTINQLFNNQFSQTNMVLPIGISFFTFQAISYVIDIYRGKGLVQKNALNVGLYISFFPQLIAGPIVRYETFSSQIDDRDDSLHSLFCSNGFSRFITGLGKKVLLSNSFALVSNQAFDNCNVSELSVLFSWLGAISYSLQIFYDFSGYSDMAIGLGKIFGFDFEENFNYPYTSKSISEFWRRWHISLGTWFRDYLYFPLGGSRVSTRFRLVFNLFCVWFLTGLWHGANWTFILWGLFYFLIISFEKLTQIPAKLLKQWQVVAYQIFTITAVIFGWVLFRSTTISNAWQYLKSMLWLNNNAFIDNTFIFLLVENLIVIACGLFFSTPTHLALFERVKNKFIRDIYLILKPITCSIVFVLCVSYLVKGTYNPFIYFNF